MKLGLLSAILEGYSFEEMIDIVSGMGFACVEVACWPQGKAERRYAGVSHIDVEHLDAEEAGRILSYCRERKVEISSLGYYPNTMDPDREKREGYISHLMKLIDASALLDVNMVTTFIGRDQSKSVEKNLELVKGIWPPILAHAKEKGVKVAIENCPMLFGEDQWPGGHNLMTTPENWKKIFDILPDSNLGINYDPSHFVWQMVDYIQPLYEFRDKIFHVHYKDIKMYPEKLKRAGTMAYPLEYMSPKIPGLGDVDWAKFVSALTDIGYNGYTCIEVEDKAFEGSQERVLESIRLSKRYLEQFVV